jgi:hypothetical protein
MSFNYDVQTEEEAQKAREFQLLPDGVYDFAVTEAKFQWSQSGNPMIALKLRIIHEGEEYNVFDNLIGTKNMGWKTKHFCETTGLEKEYLAGQFSEHCCPQRRGTCSIGNVAARPKNDGTGGMWKAKNEVTDYLSPDKISGAQAAATAKASASTNAFAPPAAKLPPAPESEPFLNDDIPF